MNKEINDEIILQHAELLIDKYNSTTTIDVKNRFKTAGYKPFHSDVEKLLRKVALQEGWQMNTRKYYTIYSFGLDTKEKIKLCLQKGEEIWEVQIAQANYKQVWIRSNETIESQLFRNNKKAVKFVKKLINKKKKEGFKEVEAPKSNLYLRAKFTPYLKEAPEKLILGFYNVKRISLVKDIRINDNLEVVSNLGGDFIWEKSFKNVAPFLEQEFNQNTFESSQFSNILVKGEKMPIGIKEDNSLKPNYSQHHKVLSETFDFSTAKWYSSEILFASGASFEISTFEKYSDAKVQAFFQVFKDKLDLNYN